jgi:hypothetical protein
MSNAAKTLIKIVLLLLSIAVLLFVCLVGSGTLSGSLSSFGFNPVGGAQAGTTANSNNPAWPLGGLTIAGVLASLAVNVLRAQNQNAVIDYRAFFSGMLYPQTFIAICVSPVVFFGAMLALNGNDLGPSVYLAAFQNGFFWQRILDAKKP